MRLWAAALAVLLVLGGAAEARMHAPYRGHRIVPAATAPLDTFATPAAAYSFRKLRSDYAGSAVKLRRTTGGTLDVGFLGFVPGLGSPIDIAAANTFCAATTCFVETWYDQSGNGRNVVQATAANQPQFVFNCIGSLPCLGTTADTQILLNAASITSVSPVSLSAVAQRTASAAGICVPVFYFFHQVYSSPGAAGWTIQASGSQGLPATDGVWHAVNGVIGPSAVIRVDDAEQAGTVTTFAGGGTIELPKGAAAGTTCSFGESVLWNGYGLTANERAALVNNQRAFWGF